MGEGHSRSDDLGATTSGSTVAAAAEGVGGVQPSSVAVGEPKRATVVGGPPTSIPGSPGTTASGADAATQVAAVPSGVSPPTADAVASASVPFASAQDRVLVPREAVGFVIGKSGETIKEMMARTGAHIEVDRGDVDPATPTRVFNILGDARACAAARALIGEKVTGVLHNKPTSAAGIPNVLLPGTANSRELWVPGDRVGSIIGARGQVVRRLQEQSGATIVIHNERVNASAEKLVTIVGGVAQLDHATTLIEDVIRKPRQPSLPAYPAALSGQVRDAYVYRRPVVMVASRRVGTSLGYTWCVVRRRRCVAELALCSSGDILRREASGCDGLLGVSRRRDVFPHGLRPRRACVSGPLLLFGDGVQFLTSGSACFYLVLTA